MLYKGKSFTPNTPLIQPSFTSSKWNMGEFFGLNFHLSYLHKAQSCFFEIPSCGKMDIFISKFVIWWKSPPFYEVK